MTINRKKIIRRAALVVLLIATFFMNNRVIAPDIMECRNLVTAREMINNGWFNEHWLVPTMNGELRVEKPPLPTWFAAVGEMISPDNLALQRGIAGTAAVMLVVFAGLFARPRSGVFVSNDLKNDSGISWMVVVLLCTSYSVILMGRTATWDIFCHAFMMGAIYFLARALAYGAADYGAADSRPPINKRESLRSWLLAGLFAGLSIMSKGPVSLYALLLPFLISYAVVMRPNTKGCRSLQLSAAWRPRSGSFVATPLSAAWSPPPRNNWTGVALAVVVMLVVGMWWYVAVYLAEPEAMAAVSGKEAGAWIGHNVRPWWYYRTFPLETGVWAVLLVTALVAPLFGKQLRKDKGYMLCALWTLLAVVLLSLFPEKKNRYLLPMLIPACLTMACLVKHWATQWRFRASRDAQPLSYRRPGVRRPVTPWLFRLNALAIALCVLVLPVAAYLFIYKEGALGTVELVAWTAFFIAVAAWLVVAAVRLRPQWMLLAVATLFVVAECFALPRLDVVINNVEKHSIALLKDDKRALATEKPLRGRRPGVRPNLLPLYHDSRVPLRIEIVYAAGRQIRPLTLTNVDSVRRHLPCILLTHGDVREVLPPAVLSQIDTLRLDTFDDNPRPRGTRRYSEDFIYKATALSSK